MTKPPLIYGVGQILSGVGEYQRGGGLIAGTVTVAQRQHKIPVRLRDGMGGTRSVGQIYFLERDPLGNINAGFELFPRLMRERAIGRCHSLEPVFGVGRVTGHGRNLNLHDVSIIAADLVEEPSSWVQPIELSCTDPRRHRSGHSWGVTTWGKDLFARVYDYGQHHPYRPHAEEIDVHPYERAWQTPKPVDPVKQPKLAAVRAMLAGEPPPPAARATAPAVTGGRPSANVMAKQAAHGVSPSWVDEHGRRQHVRVGTGRITAIR